MREFIVNLAMKFQGTPYIWGGSNPHIGFDCSGFCIWILQVFNILPSGDWTAEGLRKHFAPTTIAEVGDLVFYGNKINGATHVMMFIGNNLCIGATGGGRTCTNEEVARQLGARVKIKRVDYRNDLISFASIGIQ